MAGETCATYPREEAIRRLVLSLLAANALGLAFLPLLGAFAWLDNAVVAPVARGYQKVVPQVVRSGVSNFFGNFGDAWSAINHLLQGKPTDAAEMTIRVATNSVFGIAGLFDVASELGIERRSRLES